VHDESAVCSPLILCSSRSAQPSVVFIYVSLTALLLYGKGLSFNHLIYSVLPKYPVGVSYYLLTELLTYLLTD